MIVGVGTEFILQGPERKGLYVEDEDNYYSCIKQPTSPYLTSYYVEDENNIGSVGKIGTAHSSGTYYKGNGSTGYLRGSSVTARTGYTAYSGKLYDADGVRVNSSTTYFFGGSEKTLYKGDGSYVHDRGNSVDAIEYDGTLYEHGGNHTYPLYKKVSKNLYAAGSTVTYPAYKEYGGKVYDAGQRAVIKPADVKTENVTALTV